MAYPTLPCMQPPNLESEEPMNNYLEELRTKVGHAMGSGQIHPVEKETIELLKEQGYDFTPYIPGAPQNDRREE